MTQGITLGAADQLVAGVSLDLAMRSPCSFTVDLSMGLQESHAPEVCSETEN